MIKKINFLLIFFFCIKSTCFAILNKSLYIHSGYLNLIDSVQIPVTTFNDVDSFSYSSSIIESFTGDTVALNIVNRDSVTYKFAINGLVSVQDVYPGDSLEFSFITTTSGIWLYKDPSYYPNAMYLGLGGMLVVKDHYQKSFYWNLREHDPDWNTLIFNGNNVDWSLYNPKYFTINGNSYPETNQDETARVVGNLGDTLWIYIVNTGQSIHSIHFHGYHAVVEHTSNNQSMVGRLKDTFALYPGEGLVLSIVPDKIGEYPVHDHNLIGVTANLYYSNGMFTSILISP